MRHGFSCQVYCSIEDTPDFISYAENEVKLSCHTVPFGADCSLQTWHVRNALSSSTWTVRPFESCCVHAVLSLPALVQLWCLSLCHQGLTEMLAATQPFQTVHKEDRSQEVCQSSKLPIGSLKPETLKEEQSENTNCINSVVYHKNTDCELSFK